MDTLTRQQHLAFVVGRNDIQLKPNRTNKHMTIDTLHQHLHLSVPDYSVPTLTIATPQSNTLPVYS